MRKWLKLRVTICEYAETKIAETKIAKLIAVLLYAFAITLGYIRLHNDKNTTMLIMVTFIIASYYSDWLNIWSAGDVSILSLVGAISRSAYPSGKSGVVRLRWLLCDVDIVLVEQATLFQMS